jgi:Ni2+-binding GTPase involved in maturation of urease and hydrogenase
LKLNSAARFFETSVRTGQGLEELLAYLK